jgi:hypothetical protein
LGTWGLGVLLMVMAFPFGGVGEVR